MREWSKEQADKVYGFSNWGDGYFDVSANGRLCVNPFSNKNLQIEISAVIDEMKAQGIALPAVIRFHDILRQQVKRLNKKFRATIDEADYEGKYIGVYPVKVNQMREVVEEILDAGHPYDYGLEAGSKPELLSVLCMNSNKSSLTILNGYKDENYLRLALLGRKLHRKMIVVIEKFSELDLILKLSKEMKVRPLIGVRAKMSIKGVGKWENSSGEKAKFGLSISEILKIVERLQDENMIESLQLLHFHIGSQITNIRSIKEAINEGVRIYVELNKRGVPLEYFDVGGGLGVDYDGTRSTNDSSMNYTLDEYVADIIYGVKQVCDLEGVAHPNIVSESGRAITAHHSCVVTSVIGKIEPLSNDLEIKKTRGEHYLVSNMREVLAEVQSNNNFSEMFNDACKIKEDCINAFKLGVVSIDDRAKCETLFNNVVRDIVKKVSTSKEHLPEGLANFIVTMAPQYLCNFSVFQSTADSWAIKQLLPVMPLTRLNEYPSVNCTIADITCDSDGKIDNFLCEDGLSKTVPLHNLIPGEDYHIGIFLTGAYQDVMGDMHNLFGRLNEVHVFSDPDDPLNFYIEEVILGQNCSKVLSTMQYNPEFMSVLVKREVDKEISRGNIPAREGVRLVDFYEECLKGYTYLE